jgi:HSP20 family protein
MPKEDKKKKPEVFDDLMEINRLIAGILSRMSKDFARFEDMAVTDFRREPMIFGFNVRMGSDGKPVVERFGNVRADQQPKISITEEREPLIDVIVKADEVTVIAELPGVSEGDIRMKAGSDSLKIEAKGRTRSYNKLVKISSSINPVAKDTMFHNGILEVNFARAPPSEKTVTFGVFGNIRQSY